MANRLRAGMIASLAMITSLIAASCGTVSKRSDANTAGNDTLVLRAGCSQPKGSILCDQDDHFAQEVSRLSQGKMKINVYYQSLGVEQQLAQSTISGSVDIGQLSSAGTATFSQAFLPFTLPFLFSNYDDLMSSFSTDTGRRLVDQFDKDLNVKTILILNNGSGRDIQTRSKQVKVPSDLTGLKMRVAPNDTEIATFRSWGANATPMDYSQVPSALKEGVIDGMESTYPAVFDEQLYANGLKYDVRLDWQMLFSVWFMNGNKYASLTDSQKDVLKQAQEPTKEWARGNARDLLAKVGKELSANGVTVYYPTAAELTEWRASRESVWQSVVNKSNGALDLSIARQLSGS